MENDWKESLLYFFSPETLDALENESDYSFEERGFVKTYDWRIIRWIDHLMFEHDRFPELMNRYGINPKRAARRMIDTFLSSLEELGVEEPELLVCHADFLDSWNFRSGHFIDPNDRLKEWLDRFDKEDVRDALNERLDYIIDFDHMMEQYAELREPLDEQ